MSSRGPASDQYWAQTWLSSRVANVALMGYSFLLVAGTHWPRSHFPDEKSWLGADKLLHLLAYAGLSTLALFALRLWRPAAWSNGIAARRSTFVLGLLLAAVGLADEVTQPLVGRDFEWADWAADCLGVAFGLALAGHLWHRLSPGAKAGDQQAISTVATTVPWDVTEPADQERASEPVAAGRTND